MANSSKGSFANMKNLKKADVNFLDGAEDISSMFENDELLNEVVMGELKPTTATNAFKGTSSSKKIIAYNEQVQTWISTNASDMGLDNYTTEVKEEPEHRLIIHYNYEGKDSEVKLIGEGDPLGLVDPIRDKYDFRWWTLDKDGKNKDVPKNMGPTDITVYAQWEYKYNKTWKYSEIDDNAIAKLAGEEYNLTIDCSDALIADLKGTTSTASLLSTKLNKANSNTRYNLTLSNLPADYTDARGCFYGNTKVKSFKISGKCNVTNASYMFRGCSNLTSIDTKGFTSVTNASGMFISCYSLTSIDTSGFTKVTKAECMFQYCSSLTSIDTKGFTSVTDASSMFYQCSSLTSIDTKGFTNVTNAVSMFNNCRSLTSIDTTAFTNVTDANNIFQGCSSLTNIDTTAFTKVTDAKNMFNGCSSLTSIDTKGFTNVTNASSMFYQCSSLTSIDTKGFTNVTDASNMFSTCSSLTSIDTKGFTSVTNANGMFNSCSSLTSIDTKAFTKVTNASYMFSSCYKLTSIYWGDSFRPVYFDSMFPYADAAKVITASAESKAWIEKNATAMKLTNYTINPKA